MPNSQAPHQGIILVRVKNHELSPDGECIPPVVSDTQNIIMSIKGKNKAELETRTQEFLTRVKEWIAQYQ